MAQRAIAGTRNGVADHGIVVGKQEGLRGGLLNCPVFLRAVSSFARMAELMV